MGKRLIINLIVENAGRIGKSISSAYQKVVNSGAAQQSGFGKAAQDTFGRFISRPMTRDEAIKILGIVENEELEGASRLDPKQVMERFDTLIEKNTPEKGGSFYIQSKVFFAKEHLMQDFPPEMNDSQHNPSEEEDQAEQEDKETPKEDEEKQDGKEGEKEERKERDHK